MKRLRSALLVVAFLAAIGLTGCSTMQPPGTGNPRAADYPPLYEPDDARRNATTSAISRLLQTTGNSAENDLALSPVTLTIENLPAGTRQPAYLPKLGTDAQMSEEETRESLRRFIKDWQDLIGADPAKLSLVERVDQPDGTKVALYEQRPFRYPIRGNFGKLEIRFTADRRLVNLSSTCIPDADRVQTALSAIAVKLKPEDAINQIANNGITHTDAAANQQTLRPAANQLRAKELVTFVRKSSSAANALEFHVAWEIEVSGSAVKNVYVDAVNGEAIQ
jgi:hypothetical protein